MRARAQGVGMKSSPPHVGRTHTQGRWTWPVRSGMATGRLSSQSPRRPPTCQAVSLHGPAPPWLGQMPSHQ